MPIQIGNATIEYTPEGCITLYPNGTSYGAHPHHEDHLYTLIAARCGYSPDHDGRLQYAREHEVCHHIVGCWIKGGGSDVIGPLAHGKEPCPIDALLEESLVMTLQRWLRANERPIVAGADWDDIKRRALGLLDGL